MKLKVSMPGTYMVMELEESQTRRMFWKMAELLHLSEKEQMAEGVHPPSRQFPEQEAPSEKIKLPLVSEEQKRTEPVKLPDNPKIMYKGFLYIKCPHCGEVKGYFTRNEMEYYFCKECEVTTYFDQPLNPLYVRCECGKGIRYMTNMQESAFDINCLECGAPVAVHWNAKKKLYETIREDLR